MKSRDRLTTAEWVQAALDVLAADGLAAVGVEPLARRLGVTKGSFYWHFRDRQALLSATLEAWEQRTTEEVITALQALASPRERLTRLLRSALDPASDRHHMALAAAIGDPLVGAALQRVTRRRLEYLATCFADLGLNPSDAGHRARLAYAAYLGTKHLALEMAGASSEDHRDYVEHTIRTLIG